MCKEDSRAINCRRRYHSRYLFLVFCVHNRAIELQARAAHHHVTIIVNFMRIPSHMSITTFLPRRRFVSHPPKKAHRLHIVVCSLSRSWGIRRLYTSVTILSTDYSPRIMASKSMLIMTRTGSHDCAIKCPSSAITSFKKNAFKS